MKKLKYFLIYIIIIFLCGCKFLIKDEPKSGVNYVPLDYKVDSINYITNVDSNELTTRLNHIDDSNYKLSIFAPLTNCDEIVVENVKVNNYEINVTLDSAKITKSNVKKPIVTLSLTGLNPYKNSEYKVHVDTKYDRINLWLTRDEAFKILKAEEFVTPCSPIYTDILKNGNSIFWKLGFYEINSESKSPIRYTEAIINDRTRELLNVNSIDMSKPILNGTLISSLDKNNFLYEEENKLHIYNIPHNTSKTLDISITDNCAFSTDFINNDIAINFADNNFAIVDKFHNIRNLKADLNPDVKFFGLYGGNLYIAGADNVIYKFDGKNTQEIYTSDEEITGLSVGKEITFSAIDKFGEENIFILNQNGKKFISKGSAPKINDDRILFKMPKSGKSVDLFSYNLSTGLLLKVYTGTSVTYNRSGTDEFKIFDNEEAYFNAYKLSDDNLTYICPLKESNISDSAGSTFFTNYDGKIYILNLKNQTK